MSTLIFLAIKISFSAAVIVLIYGTRRTGLLPSGLMKCHSRNKQINKIWVLYLQNVLEALYV